MLIVFVFCFNFSCVWSIFCRFVFGLVWCLSVCLFTWLAVLRLSFFLDCFLFRFSGLFRFRARLRIYDGNGQQGSRTIQGFSKGERGPRLTMSMVIPGVQYFASLRAPKTIRGLSKDNPRTIRGLSEDNPRIIRGLSENYACLFLYFVCEFVC